MLRPGEHSHSTHRVHTLWLQPGVRSAVVAVMDGSEGVRCSQVVRDQYFFLGENLLSELPQAAQFVVATFVIVEMAEDCNEGLVYGLLTTMGNLGQAIPQAISNQLFGAFKPSLSDPANYIAARGGDLPCFRRVVGLSFGVGYLFAFASLLTLPLLPDQKAQAQERKRNWEEHTGYAVATVLLISVAMAYTVRRPLLPWPDAVGTETSTRALPHPSLGLPYSPAPPEPCPTLLPCLPKSPSCPSLLRPSRLCTAHDQSTRYVSQHNVSQVGWWGRLWRRGDCV